MLGIHVRSARGMGCIVVALWSSACWGGGSDGAEGASGGSTGNVTVTGTNSGGGSGGTAATTLASTTDASTSSGAVGGSTSSGGSATTGALAELPEPFPDGSGYEYRGIVNLVNQEAVALLEEHMLAADRFTGGTSDGTTMAFCSQLFFRHYADEYDFVYYILDHGIDTTVQGLHSHANRPSLLGTGLEEPQNSEVALPRTRSVVAIQVPDFEKFPPFAHELVHHFGADLADEFGFGHDVDTDFGGHWGMTSVNGQLGGFDGASLACETPAGGSHPECEANSEGRMRYLVDQFYPNTVTSRAKPYGPLELYLMGLLPAAEVPSPILRFDGADFDFEEAELTAEGKRVIDATGITEIPLSDIIARHGEVPLLPDSERHFSAAFVLVTAEPASQAHLDRIADWAAIFGGELESDNPEWVSFSELTGGRATLTTRVGDQRELGADEVLDFTAPPERTCSPDLQDCGSGLACYGRDSFYCAVDGAKPEGEGCAKSHECGPGLVCSRTLQSTTTRFCAPYCDPVDRTADDGCDTLCPNNEIPIFDVDGVTPILAYCVANVGGRCDPLAQDCGDGLACTGTTLPSCELEGDTPLGELCDSFGACVQGGACIGAESSDVYYCQAFCDPSDSAPADIACSALCAFGAWHYDGYSICITEDA